MLTYSKGRFFGFVFTNLDAISFFSSSSQNLMCFKSLFLHVTELEGSLPDVMR